MNSLAGSVSGSSRNAVTVIGLAGACTMSKGFRIAELMIYHWRESNETIASRMLVALGQGEALGAAKVLGGGV